MSYFKIIVIAVLFTLSLGGCKSQQVTQSDGESWKSQYLKEFNLKESDDNKLSLRIWKRYHHLISLEVSNNQEGLITLVNYIDEVDKDYKKEGVYFHITEFKGDTLKSFIDTIQGYLPLLREHKNVTKYVGATYDFEIAENGNYNDFFVISDLKTDTLRIAELLRFVEREFNTEAMYSSFKKKLPPGAYYDGKNVTTIFK